MALFILIPFQTSQFAQLVVKSFPQNIRTINIYLNPVYNPQIIAILTIVCSGGQLHKYCNFSGLNAPVTQIK